MRTESLRVNIDRLIDRIEEMGKIGALEGGGVCRLALSDEDRKGRDLLISWMNDLGLKVSIDRIGNIVGTRAGQEDSAPVMAGSHIDSVATGGLYDGVLGVLSGLEIIAVLNDEGITTRRPIAVGAFTNEEGARFAPDMMGSGVHQGSMDLDDMLASPGIDGSNVGENLQKIGYDGPEPIGKFRAHAFFELHVEQGPVLEEEQITIGAVTGVQGISWTEFRLTGVSNHAGTTPMRLRHDAGYAAAAIATEARAIAKDLGGDQVATVGVNELNPNLVNVIAKEALMTVDLRNTDDEALKQAEARMMRFAATVAQAEGVKLESRTLARFAPVEFDSSKVAMVENKANELGHSVRRMPSGAGHDAQMFAPNCPTAMIFVPSRGGISHNVEEFTSPEHIHAGANVLLQAMMESAE
ncbi:MAG: Zn-dependent hydrolase [Rhodobacteraceae bacterium]|nr:Zn-dependent hydrolase [Paracoccaceae bacterium]